MATNIAAPPPAFPAGARERPQSYPALHGLRGALALWVVLYHLTPGRIGLVGGALRANQYGYLAVDIFFVMSGFILFHAHGRHLADLRVDRLVEFFRLRFWRTMPMHLASVALALAVSGLVVHEWPSRAALLRAVLLLDTWNEASIAHRINGPVWSLHVEWVGYLCMPLLFVALQKWRVRRWLGWLALGTALGQVAIMAGLSLSPSAFEGPGALVRMAGGCGLGCVLWTLRDHPLMARLEGDAALLLACAGAIAILEVASPVFVTPMLAVIVMALTRPGRLAGAMLTNRAMLFLGRISFSLYITHYPVMCAYLVLQRAGAISSAVASVLTLTTALALASAVCVTIEEPTRRFGRQRFAFGPAWHSLVAPRLAQRPHRWGGAARR